MITANSLNTVVTCNKTRLFFSTIQKQSISACSGKLPHMRRWEREKNLEFWNKKIKHIMLVIFHIRWISMAANVPPHHILNQQFYIQVLTKLQKRITKSTSSWRTPPMLKCPPHLAPCNFSLFPELRKMPNRTQFSVNWRNPLQTSYLKHTSQNSFRECFNAWKDHI